LEADGWARDKNRELFRKNAQFAALIAAGIRMALKARGTGGQRAIGPLCRLARLGCLAGGGSSTRGALRGDGLARSGLPRPGTTATRRLPRLARERRTRCGAAGLALQRAQDPPRTGS
jgi:hypothetical protein